MAFTFHDKYFESALKVEGKYGHETAAELVWSIAQYGTTGEAPAFSDPVVELLFDAHRDSIECSVNARTKNKGGRPTKKKGNYSTGSTIVSSQEDFKKAHENHEEMLQNDKMPGKTPVLENENPRFEIPKPPFLDEETPVFENENPIQYMTVHGSTGQYREEEKNNARAREEEGPLAFHGGEPEPFEPPTVEEVRSYCAMCGMPDDAERFVAYYSALGWRKGSTPIRDWKSLVTLWNLNNKSWRAEKASRERSGGQERAADSSAGLSVPVPDHETPEGRQTLLGYYRDGTLTKVSARCWEDLRWAYKKAIDAMVPFPQCPDYATATQEEQDEFKRLWKLRSDVTTSDAAARGDILGCLALADELLGEGWTRETRGEWLDL